LSLKCHVSASRWRGPPQDIGKFQHAAVREIIRREHDRPGTGCRESLFCFDASRQWAPSRIGGNHRRRAPVVAVTIGKRVVTVTIWKGTVGCSILLVRITGIIISDVGRVCSTGVATGRADEPSGSYQEGAARDALSWVVSCHGELLLQTLRHPERHIFLTHFSLADDDRTPLSQQGCFRSRKRSFRSWGLGLAAIQTAPIPLPFCAFCVLCGFLDWARPERTCDPGTHLGHPVLPGNRSQYVIDPCRTNPTRSTMGADDSSLAYIPTPVSPSRVA